MKRNQGKTATQNTIGVLDKEILGTSTYIYIYIYIRTQLHCSAQIAYMGGKVYYFQRNVPHRPGTTSNNLAAGLALPDANAGAAHAVLCRGVRRMQQRKGDGEKEGEKNWKEEGFVFKSILMHELSMPLRSMCTHLAAKDACVLGTLGDLNLLGHLTESRTIAGTVLASNAQLLRVASHFICSEKAKE